MTTTHETHSTHSHAHDHGTSGHSTNRISTVAASLFNKNADWATFFREILGKDGIVSKAYPTPEALEAFKQTEEYAEIERQFNQLRSKKGAAAAVVEPTKVITVRMPKSMHEYLLSEAEKHNTSMNSLCISRLLKVIDQPNPVEHNHNPAPAKSHAPATQTSTSHSHEPSHKPTASQSHTHAHGSHTETERPHWSNH